MHTNPERAALVQGSCAQRSATQRVRVQGRAHTRIISFCPLASARWQGESCTGLRWTHGVSFWARREGPQVTDQLQQQWTYTSCPHSLPLEPRTPAARPRRALGYDFITRIIFPVYIRASRRALGGGCM